MLKPAEKVDHQIEQTFIGIAECDRQTGDSIERRKTKRISFEVDEKHSTVANASNVTNVAKRGKNIKIGERHSQVGETLQRVARGRQQIRIEVELNNFYLKNIFLNIFSCASYGYLYFFFFNKTAGFVNIN